jgi:hypothetical protein
MLMLQVPGPGQAQRGHKQSHSSNPVFQETDAVATFDGTFKSADKKHVLIDVENGQTMQMFITGSTKFIKQDKPVRPADFQSGEPVTVEAARDARYNLVAVRVMSKKEQRQPDKKTGAADKNSN